ncbi:MAG: phosphoenolpyruvate hydrolase family protein [Chloroflexota bacterium]|nr:phosphoenolpyruvate hydrolase family protein [Chloroflexota bacterium]
MINRAEILSRLRATLAKGDAIIGAGCSAGIVAKCAELGGADLIVCYSTGRSRIMGLRTEVIGHSNPRTLDMYDEISNVVNDSPIIAGIEANDQTTYDLGIVIDRFVDRGFDGFINFPTVGNHERVSDFFLREYENIASSLQQPWGFAREVELIRLLRARDVFTMCYVFNAEQAARMAEAGVDVVCAHVGGTAGGLIGFPADPMEESLDSAQRIMEGAWNVDPDVICLAHGGPFAEPEDTRVLYERTDAQGFVGASSIERIPIEKAVMSAVKGFKNHKVRER